MKFTTSMMAVPALAAVIGLSACSVGTKEVDKADVAKEISSQLEAKVGTAPENVECPENLEAKKDATLVCTLTDSGESYDVNVTVTSVEGDNTKFDIKVADQPNA